MCSYKRNNEGHPTHASVVIRGRGTCFPKLLFSVIALKTALFLIFNTLWTIFRHSIVLGASSSHNLGDTAIAGNATLHYRQPPCPAVSPATHPCIANVVLQDGVFLSQAPSNIHFLAIWKTPYVQDAGTSVARPTLGGSPCSSKLFGEKSPCWELHPASIHRV